MKTRKNWKKEHCFPPNTCLCIWFDEQDKGPEYDEQIQQNGHDEHVTSFPEAIDLYTLYVASLK